MALLNGNKTIRTLEQSKVCDSKWKKITNHYRDHDIGMFPDIILLQLGNLLMAIEKCERIEVQKVQKRGANQNVTYLDCQR